MRNITIGQQSAALIEALNKTAKGRKAGAVLESHSGMATRIAKRQFARYLKAGGDGADWQAFLKWLIENLPAIIAAIMALFG